MERLKLRFPEHHHPDMSLGDGVHCIGRIGDTVGLVGEADAPVIRLYLDRRGAWMTVADGARGVHVNGRPVKRMAMLRPGDAIYLDGVEMVLVPEHSPEPLPASLRHVPGEFQGDARVLVRAVGGRYHGRSFTLEAPRLVGRSTEADIRIDDPAFPERHARIEMIGRQIALRDLSGGEGSMVNGMPVRDALLQPGDQIVFDTHHRFVIEAPARCIRQLGQTRDPPDPAPETVRPSGSGLRRPWLLLLAAAALASAITALLLWGGG